MRRVDPPGPSVARPRSERQARSRLSSLRPWLGAALALHAAFWVGSAWLEREAAPPRAPRTSTHEPFWLDLEEPVTALGGAVAPDAPEIGRAHV